jgi:hypothetical protein
MEELKPFLYEYAYEQIERMLKANPEYITMTDDELYAVAAKLEAEFKSYSFDGDLKYSPAMPKHAAAVWLYEYVYARRKAATKNE